MLGVANSSLQGLMWGSTSTRPTTPSQSLQTCSPQTPPSDTRARWPQTSGDPDCEHPPTENSSRVGPGNTGNSVSLHLDGLDITSLYAFIYVGEVSRSGDIPSLQELPLASITFDFQRTIMMLTYATEPFAEGSSLHLAVSFEADIGSSIRDIGYGLYKVPCLEGSNKYCWWVNKPTTCHASYSHVIPTG